MSVETAHTTWLKASRLEPQAPTADGADCVATVVVPYTVKSRAQRTCKILLERAGVPLNMLAVLDDQQRGPLAIWNFLFDRTRSPYFAYVADDAFPGRGWLRVALQSMEKIPQAGLLAFNDGKWFGHLAGFGLVRRSWVGSVYPKGLFHAEYRRHYADTELTLIARQQNALVYDPHAILVEVDHDKDRREVDPMDRQLFRQRQLTGFEGRVTDPRWLKLFS